ncbi:monoglyceride lipase-like isoform X2 [Branchiostoma lanceolatum]|uniref:monoglyceride lipase-like isoform X2 n=1 Tax=Branchiostoma lanceolatum TaxID=7740 RepID=UPI0034570ACD
MAPVPDTDRRTPQGVRYSTVPHIVNSDGQYLYCRTWEPTLQAGQKLRALLFVSHGLGSHCGVLGPILAQLLNSHGFLVFGHDHVGHGESEGERVHVGDFGPLARDLIQHVDMMVAKYPGVPVFLFGHSIGGAVAFTASCQRPGFFRGMVLSGPAIENSYTKADILRWTLLWTVAYIWPYKNIGPSRNAVLTKDTKKARKYAEDPLVYKGDYRLYSSCMVLYAIKTGKGLLPTVDCPFLVLHGEDDEHCDISGSWKLYEQARSKDKEIKTYPNCRHVLLLETPEDVEKVKQDILDWYLARVDPAESAT